MFQILPHIFLIAAFWAVLYWIVGGVIFAIVAIFQLEKIRRARFSCLFSLASAFCGFGAAYSGAYFAQSSIQLCLEQDAGEMFGRLSSVIACGILEQAAAGFIWFLILFGLGLLALVASRAQNQSWMDSNEHLDESRLNILEM